MSIIAYALTRGPLRARARSLPMVAITALAIASLTLEGCSGRAGSVVPSRLPDCFAVAQPASASRTTHDVLTGADWYPSPPTENPAAQYVVDGSRPVNDGDSAITGAPTHGTPGKVIMSSCRNGQVGTAA